MVFAAVTTKRVQTRYELQQQEPDEGAAVMLELEKHALFRDVQLTGYEDEQTRRLKVADHLIRKTNCVSLRPLLPLLLELKGKPYALDDYFPFEPWFRTRVPKALLYKTGRQVAKCFHASESQEVWLDDGRPVPATSLRAGQNVLVYDAHFRAKSRRIKAIHDSGQKPVFRVTTRQGSVVEIAAEHRLRTLFGHTRLDQLKVGSRIASVRQGGRFGDWHTCRDRVILTAYLIGDGSAGVSGNFNVTSACQAVLDEVERLAQRYQDRPVRVSNLNGARTPQVNLSQRSDNQVRRWLEEDGLWDHHAWDKFVPNWVWQLSEGETSLFISRLWATDGCITTTENSTPSITYSSTSRRLARQVRALLAKYGIPAGVSPISPVCNGKPGRPAWVVRVETREGWRRFLENFDVPGKPPVPIPDTEENNNRDTIPIEVQETISLAGKSLRWKKHGALLSAGLRGTLKYAPSRPKLRQYVEHFRRHAPAAEGLSFLEDVQDGDVYWDEIVSIEPIGVEQTLDIEIDDAELHTFVIDGALSHNTTSLAAQGILFSNCVSHYTTLYITPLYETIRRFSQSYVRPFIETSPVKHLFSGSKTINSVLQRTFKNRSQMFFSFAFLNAERTRGIPSDAVSYDEIQDLNYEFVPIIRETMSGSKWGLERFTGTPKSLDNTIHQLWSDSSQAEWVIKCHRGGCGHWNIPAIEWDLIEMIGQDPTGVSEKSPGLICAKCAKPLRPRMGRWIHAYPKKRWEFAGYHVPQVIMPMHYASEEKWAILVGKQQGRGNTRTNVFFNEVCGESYDTGSKVCTETDLKEAAILPWHNKVDEAEKEINRYERRVLAVDWGGGGKKGVSFTALAVLGMQSDGKIDCIWGMRSLTPHDHVREARLCIGAMNRFKCGIMAHDYTGAGARQETIVHQCGLPMHRIMPIWYTGTAQKSIMLYRERTEDHPRDVYYVDKSRSLLLTCNQIKYGWLRFFKYDYNGPDDRGLLRDFLALMDEKVDSRIGRDLYTIVRDPAQSDDFAQAVNMGCCALWYMSKKWPNLAVAAKMQMDPDLIAVAQGRNIWTDI